VLGAALGVALGLQNSDWVESAASSLLKFMPLIRLLVLPTPFTSGIDFKKPCPQKIAINAIIGTNIA